MKPKAKTLIEKQGFLDPDRSLPLHDEIQLWILNNLEEVLSSLRWKLRADRSIPFTNEYWGITPILEKPIVAQSYKSQFVVGFIDVYVQLRSRHKYQPVNGLPIESNFIDTSVSIEIKTQISVGELLRQVNFYRVHLSTLWLVVAPDATYRDVLKSQNIHFYKFS